jgi:hypothetical protein
MKKLGLYIGMLVVTFLLIVLMGEVVLRLFSPVEYLSPRYKYSAKYGFSLFEDTRMEHSVPGKYKYYYTVNHYGYRGEPVDLAPSYDRPNIIVLGDSYTFGMGVNDGEEYAALLDAGLADYRVVNLGNPGWGLTQEIRRYYDLGTLYQPRAVILQFCSNDPDDNLNNRVTRLQDGQFRFVDNAGHVNWTKKYLSRSFIQKSQLYNFFRNRVYLLFRGRALKREEAELAAREQDSNGGAAAVTNKFAENVVGQSDHGTDQSEYVETPKEKLHADLLEAFADDLSREGVALIVIAVNGQLDDYPGIRRRVDDMAARGAVRYVEVSEWFEGVYDFGSPEGHAWGAPAHAIIARELADVIDGMQLDSPATAPSARGVR